MVDRVECPDNKNTQHQHHLLLQVIKYGERMAICTPENSGGTSYADLCAHACGLSRILLKGESSLNGQRVAFMCGRNESYVIAQWAIWASGGIAVPLHPTHPAQEIQYVLNDCSASMILTDSKHLKVVTNAVSSAIPIQLVEESEPIHNNTITAFNPDNFSLDKMAQILYTSGTTGKPKGVVASHRNLTAQIMDLVQAWEVTHNDQILHFLPLHHIHGILNNLLLPLYCGGCVHLLPAADPRLIWKHMENATILMAVPTIYHRLVECYNNFSEEEERDARQRSQRLRVCISGSMSCPVPLISKWETITGRQILERYGMTELGMVLSQPLHGTRHPGYVGVALPSVRVKLDCADTEGPGELLVKGDTVFESYWNCPEATTSAFDPDGWFKTGDMVDFSVEKQNYRILGRMSVDILKSAGYKISAVEIEAVLLQCPWVAEAYVVGEPDEKWGQVVTAVVRVANAQTWCDDSTGGNENNGLSYSTTRREELMIDQHARTILASYKVPRRYVFLDTIPKNAMGKVNKKELLNVVAAKSSV